MIARVGLMSDGRRAGESGYGAMLYTRLTAELVLREVLSEDVA